MADTVTRGPYATFTAAEIADEWTKYKAAKKAATAQTSAAGGGQIVGASINGQSMQFAYLGGFSSLHEWLAELSNAQAQLDDESCAYIDRAIAGAGAIS